MKYAKCALLLLLMLCLLLSAQADGSGISGSASQAVEFYVYAPSGATLTFSQDKGTILRSVGGKATLYGGFDISWYPAGQSYATQTVPLDKASASIRLGSGSYTVRVTPWTLERLKTDYLDLLFIHQPSGNWLAGYRQLEKAYKDGRIRSIGISDFEEEQLDELLSKAEVKPQVIQLEAHPFCTRADYRPRLEKEGLTLMSWYPLGHGDKSLVEHPLFKKLGQKYGKTPAQVILRWHTQMGFIVIPGSRSAEHIRDNADIFDFRLSDEEMAEVARLDGTKRYYIPDPKVVASYANYKPDFYND